MLLTLLRPDSPDDAAPRSLLNGCHPRPVNGYALANARVLRYLAQRYPEILSECQKLAGSRGLAEEAQAGLSGE
jgi:hypothetical protein